MKFLELVNKRQSTRKYLPDKVPREVADRCLEAARLAPSACNAQPWSFIAVDDERLINKLADHACRGVYSINSFAKNTPLLVVIITERTSYVASLGGFFRGMQYSLIDIGMACGHFVLQAEEEGLGTCVLGWFNEKAVKKILGIPKSKRVDLIISVGYPANKKTRPKMRKTLSEIRAFNPSADRQKPL